MKEEEFKLKLLECCAYIKKQDAYREVKIDNMEILSETTLILITGIIAIMLLILLI